MFGSAGARESVRPRRLSGVVGRLLNFTVRRQRRGLVTILDRIFGWLLVVGGLLHAIGSWRAFHSDPPQLLWALSGSLAALLVAALNLLRVGRPNDRSLAWVSFFASVAWVAVALGFGAAIGHLADPRAVIHAVNAAVLAGLSLRTLIGAARAVAA